MTRTMAIGAGAPFDGRPRPPIGLMLGWEPLEFDAEAQRLVLEFPVKPEWLNPQGVVQGGMVCAMLDAVMGILVGGLLGGEKFPSSMDLHTQFLRPAIGEKLIGEARVTKIGRQTATTYAELRGVDGKLVSTALQTAMLVAPKG